MEILSIAAAVAGIVNAATRVSRILAQIVDAPSSLADVLSEVNLIKLVFEALKDLIERKTTLAPGRAALIQLDTIVVVLTQTVLVFSELEARVASLSSEGQVKLSRWQRVLWTWKQAGASRLVNQLHRHQTTLSVILHILQWSVYRPRQISNADNGSESDLDAQESATFLRSQVEEQVESNSEMTARLEKLELPEDQNGLEDALIELMREILERDDQKLEDVTIEPPGTSSGYQLKPGETSDPLVLVSESYDVVLSNTRVYGRVSDKQIDAVTTISTIRSHAWSVLSGLSLDQISVVAVIKLPLSETELKRFQKLASSVTSTTTSPKNRLYDEYYPSSHLEPHKDEGWLLDYGVIRPEDYNFCHYGRGALTRLKKELRDIAAEPPYMCSAGPVDEHQDDIVMFRIRFRHTEEAN
jgi:hypothetical protein